MRCECGAREAGVRVPGRRPSPRGSPGRARRCGRRGPPLAPGGPRPENCASRRRHRARGRESESAKDGGKVRRQDAAAALAAAAAAVAEAAMSGRGVRGARGEGEGKVQSVYVERAHSSTIRSSSTPAATVPLRPSVGADALKPATGDVDICTIADGCRLSAASRRWRSTHGQVLKRSKRRTAPADPKLHECAVPSRVPSLFPAGTAVPAVPAVPCRLYRRLVLSDVYMLARF